jgi:Holliday junction DNA helicase RuvA
MIARIKGTLVFKSTNFLIVDVNGVGYRIFVPLSTYYALPKLGEILQLLTVTIVREDVFNLFGFLTQKEQDIFNHLISVSKIGPKLGINILSGMSAEELKEAIILGDIEKLNSIPGIGKKTAERIVLELKEKVSKALAGQPDGIHDIPSAKPEIEDALSALVNLGYKKPLAETAIKKAKADLKINNSDNSSTLEVLIRGALKILSGKP